MGWIILWLIMGAVLSVCYSLYQYTGDDYVETEVIGACFLWPLFLMKYSFVLPIKAVVFIARELPAVVGGGFRLLFGMEK